MIRDRVLRVACPQCGADSGKGCVPVRRHPAGWRMAHRARIELAVRRFPNRRPQPEALRRWAKEKRSSRS